MKTILATWPHGGEVAVRAAAANAELGGGLIDSLEAGLVAAEEDPQLVAIGRGSLLNEDGDLELDASIMDGSDLSAGAVCAVRGILPCITLARLVKDLTPHVMLAGDQARRFAIECGMKPQNLVTGEVIRRWEEHQGAQPEVPAFTHFVHDEPAHDTVTLLGNWDGHLAAASSTSGLPYKKPGRVGDSPIIGAGIYADNEMGCAGATGMGEELWKACASFRAVDLISRGAHPQEACEDVARQMVRRQPNSRETICVVIAMDREGRFGAGVTTGEFELWVWQDGDFSNHQFKGIV